MNKPMKDISVLIVTNSRASKLKRLLESILKIIDNKAVEILVLVNGEDIDTEVLLSGFISQVSNIRYYKSPDVNRGEARNFLINMSCGKIVYFLDDDVLLNSDVFSLICEKFRQYDNVSVIGGPNLNMPDCSLFQECQGHALGSFFGALWMSKRYKRSGHDRFVDESGLILCNLAVKKKLFAETGYMFGKNFVSAEENFLLSSFKRMGYMAMYIPQLEVFHERRATYKDFLIQIFTYAKGRAQILKTAPVNINLVYFIPSVFIFYLICTVFVKSTLYLNPLLAYLAFNLFFSSRIAYKNNDFRIFFILFLIFPTIHLSYGFGFLVAILGKAEKN